MEVYYGNGAHTEEHLILRDSTVHLRGLVEAKVYVVADLGVMAFLW